MASDVRPRAASSEQAADAICSDVGCVQGDVSIGAGVRLTLSRGAASSQLPSSVILLPGVYTAQTPAVDGSMDLLAPFLAANASVTATRAAGFDIYQPAGAIASASSAIVQVGITTGALVFTAPGYGGVASTGVVGATAQGVTGVRSALFAANVTALFNVIGGASGGPTVVQLWGPLIDSFGAGFGPATLNAVQVQSGAVGLAEPTDETAASIPSLNGAWCARGQFRDPTGLCSACDAGCATCWGGTASACLSCAPSGKLAGGTCVPSACAGGASATLGTCLETLVAAPAIAAVAPAPKPVNLATVLGPAIGGSIALLVIGAWLARRRARRRQTTAWSRKTRLYGPAWSNAAPLSSQPFGLASPPTKADPWAFGVTAGSPLPMTPAPVYVGFSHQMQQISAPSPYGWTVPIVQPARPLSILSSVLSDSSSQQPSKANWLKRATRAFTPAPRSAMKPRAPSPAGNAASLDRGAMRQERAGKTWIARWRTGAAVALTDPDRPVEVDEIEAPAPVTIDRSASRGRRKTGLTWVNGWAQAAAAERRADAPSTTPLARAKSKRPERGTTRKKKRMTHLTLALTEAENWTTFQGTHLRRPALQAEDDEPEPPPVAPPPRVQRQPARRPRRQTWRPEDDEDVPPEPAPAPRRRVDRHDVLSEWDNPGGRARRPRPTTADWT